MCFLDRHKAKKEYFRLNRLLWKYREKHDLLNANWCRRAMMKLRHDFNFAYPVRWWQKFI